LFSHTEGRISLADDALSELKAIAEKVEGVEKVVSTLYPTSVSHVNPYHNIKS
jgi:hypothetical protein